jgi:hypothetical protein
MNESDDAKSAHEPYQATLVAQGADSTNKHVVGNSLAEDLDVEDVHDDLLRLAVDVWMYQSNVVVAYNHVSESRQTFLHTLQTDVIWKRVAELLQLL